jgi:hypothetical protein
MRDLVFVKDRKECDRGVQLADGRIVVITPIGSSEILVRYDEPINVYKGVVYDQEDFENTALDIQEWQVLTLNGLIANHLAHDVYCYDEFYIGWDSDMKDLFGEEKNIEFDVLVDYIKKKHGITVSQRGLAHNYLAWCRDEKSGYRDEKNGVHIFSPCGCNPLSFRISTLVDGLDWQDTYTC